MLLAHLFFSLLLSVSGSAFGRPLQASAARPQKWKLVFADEFNDSGSPDPKKWQIETDDGLWGNGELQHYTSQPENLRAENGNLVIEAHHPGAGQYTSGRMHTRHSFTYGHFEVRAKFPSGAGTWPAIWMMGAKQNYGTDLWPDNGEIDLAEHVGREPDQVLGCFYTKNFNWMLDTGKAEVIDFPGTESDFHIYALDWSPEEVRISVDSVVFNVFKNPHTNWADWPYDKDFVLILNLALGSFGGDIDDSVFPQKMLVDYVRIYQLVN